MLAGKTDRLIERNTKWMRQYRELYPSLLTIALFAVFGSAIVNGVRLAFEPNARFWVGQIGLAVLLIPVFVVASHITQSYYRRPLYFSVIASCVLPTLISLIVGYAYMVPVSSAVSRLLSTDCTTFKEKFIIEQAYKSASGFFDDCLAAEAKNRTQTVEAVRKDMVVSQCPGYDPIAAGYPQEWAYLQHLEEQENCAGWCYDGEGALWTHNPKHWDSCSVSAGMTMKHLVARNAQRLMTNGVVGFVLAAGVIIGINEWTSRSEDGSMDW